MSSKQFYFKPEAKKQSARAGTMHTPHGQIQTPIFMPVGTVASVKALDSQDLTQLDADIILANTYHLYLRPGIEILKAQGGLHKYMNWQKPILTDSGGFQVFSLGDTASISNEGVEFTSHLDGSKHFFNPEKAIEIQRHIGADIIMAFDQCTEDEAPQREVEQAWQRTWQWTQQAVKEWEKHDRQSIYGEYQALFGIVQGARNQELRQQALKQLLTLDLDGIAFGGETIGYNMAATAEVLNWLVPHMPDHLPRYTMGLGRDPQDIIDAVWGGADMFDCVAPTRMARNGSLYNGEILFKEDDKPTFTSQFDKGRLRINQSQFARDSKPIDTNCACHTCQQKYSRAYLHHLYKTKELSYYRLASIHNLHFMINLTRQLRAWIMD